MTLFSRPRSVLLLSLLVTACVTVAFSLTARARDEARFESTVRMVQGRLIGRMEAHEALLRGTAGLFMASEHVTLDEFHAYVERLELEQYDPGVQGLGFSQRIPPALIYLEPPRALSQAVPGQDLSTVPTLRQAMERAWSTSRPSLSGRILLPPDESAPTSSPGFVLFVPVYRSAMNIAAGPTGPEAQEGFVHSTFRADELFTGLFNNVHTTLVSFRVYDGTEARPEALLHDSAPPEERDRAAVFTHLDRVEVAGRPWTLVFSSRPLFEWGLLRPWVSAVAVIGVLFSVLLFTFVRAQQSARSEAEAQRTQLRTITDRLPALIAYIDLQTRYRFVNQAYETWFGIRPEEAHGKTLQDILGEQGYAQVKDRIHQALAGEEVRYETELTLKDGRTLYVMPHYIPDRDEEGHVRGIVSIAHDITERKKTEEAIQQAVRLRDEFLSVASHELKTPLTSLSLRLQLLTREAQAQAASPFVGRVSTLVDAGRKQVQRLADLVGDLLDVARINSGKMQLHWEPVDFAAVVREVVARMEPQATKAESPLTVEVPQSLEGTSDRMRLEQVAENLLTNAIKYGAGQPILVRMEATPEQVTLTVKDQGIGIAPEHQARIFERFERAVSDRNYGGLGLGLYITRTLVQAMGGDIGVQSALGQGATFTVNLPRAPESLSS
jgi:PAS domain S-box-containing protein